MEPDRDTWAAREMAITQRLRRRRAELGLTQKQVVTRLGRVGIRTTNRAVSSLEHGAGVDVVKLPELAAALDCTVTYLMGLTDDPHRWKPDRELSDQAGGVPSPRAADAAEPVATTRPAPHPHSWILGAEIPDRGTSFGIGGR